jgi:DNA-binding NtrC family response regulator
MAHILVIAATRFAADAIEEAITRRGHQVTSATDFNQVKQTCTNLDFDLAVIGPSLADRIKKAIALMLRETCAGVQILEICASRPCIADADFSLRNDRFDALAQRIAAILADQSKQKLG